MSPHDMYETDDTSEIFSEGTISRCNSTEKLTLTELGDGLVEERFRVDRRKLEAMIQGCPPDPCDIEIMKLPIGMDGRILSADDFFQRVMESTRVEIKYPKFLKVGARNKKDPHVRVVGPPEAVAAAGALVRQELEPQNKVTMKLDVSWTHHSHIIGKGGNTIQPVVKRSGVSIHFPDGNKNSEVKKSNQVSINSRTEQLNGLEEARFAIRELTPLIFTFKLPTNAQFINVSDPHHLIMQVQNMYKVQVDLKLTDEGHIQGSVRGCEWDATLVKEATLCVLQAFTGPLASQMAVEMTVEISPQHHAFVLGPNNENFKRIMHRTATTIQFPDSSDSTLAPLRRSSVTISGAIENVYLARQNILGSLPLVLMFDLMPDAIVDQTEVTQLNQTLGTTIITKNKRMDGRRPVIIKGAEKNAANIYEAWRLLTRSECPPQKACIQPTYHIPDAAPLYGITTDLAGLGKWVGSGGGVSGSSSPLPSPTGDPVHPFSTLWSTAPPNTLPPAPTQRLTSQQNALLLDTTQNNYNQMLLRGAGLNGCNTLSNCGPMKQQHQQQQHPQQLLQQQQNFNSLVIRNDVSCSSSTTSSGGGGSSLSSPSPSPHADLTQEHLAHINGPTTQLHNDQDQNMNFDDFGDRRAPGWEKKRLEMASISDYCSKKAMAAKAMKEPITSNPRVPTSYWSGNGLSKSMPAGEIIRQKRLEAQQRMLKARQNGAAGMEELWEDEQMAASFNGQHGTGGGGLQYKKLPPTQLGSSLNGLMGDSDVSLSSHGRGGINLASSCLQDVISACRRDMPSLGRQNDIASILADIQLDQYIDTFSLHEVDTAMFYTLDDSDLKELGIVTFGHRKRILTAIKEMQKNVYGSRYNLGNGAIAWE